jgi:hypothetical protein
MSKYNLIDILEQYQIGSGWTNDFDYDGMLQAGLKTRVDTDIELLKKMVEDYTDVNYHREASHLYDAIEALEKGDAFEAEGRLSDFHAEIEKTMKDQGMDTSDDLGAFMASKMEENTEAIDLAIERSQEKAGIEEVSSSEGSRIEGLLNIPMKAKFLDAFEELYFDLVEEDPFAAEDVVDHLGIEMLKHLDDIQAQGDKLAGIAEEDEVKSNDEMSDDERENFYLNLDSVEEGYEDTKGKALYPILKAGANATGDEIEMYIKSLAKDIELNGKEQYKDFTSDDYVEDFKNYIADKGLQEHFGRFLKDYQ